MNKSNKTIDLPTQDVRNFQIVKEQKEEVLSVLGILDRTPSKIVKKEKAPEVNPEAVKKINNLLKSHPQREEKVKRFCYKLSEPDSFISYPQGERI